MMVRFDIFFNRVWARLGDVPTREHSWRELFRLHCPAVVADDLFAETAAIRKERLRGPGLDTGCALSQGSQGSGALSNGSPLIVGTTASGLNQRA